MPGMLILLEITLALVFAGYVFRASELGWALLTQGCLWEVSENNFGYDYYDDKSLRHLVVRKFLVGLLFLAALLLILYFPHWVTQMLPAILPAVSIYRKITP